MIETERLVIRPFTLADGPAFAEINADPRVRDWLGGVQTREESDAAMARNIADFETHGFAFMAVERKADSRLIGMAGVRWIHPDLALPKGIEAGWRLAHDCWGQGYITEAGRAVVDHAFRALDFDRVFAMTAVPNLRSQAVMRRLGMTERPDLAFDNPLLAVGHPLRPHLVFEIAAQAATHPVIPAKAGTQVF